MRLAGERRKVGVWKAIDSDDFCDDCRAGARWIVRGYEGSRIHFLTWREAYEYALWLVGSEKSVQAP